MKRNTFLDRLNPFARRATRSVNRCGPHRPRRLAIEGLEAKTLLAANPLVVNSDADIIADDGVLTFREAILEANADPDMDTIEFNINGGGAQTIILDGTLPPLAITQTVIINGPTDLNGSPLITIDAAAVTAWVPMYLQGDAGGSELRNLRISNASDTALALYRDTGGNTIENLDLSGAGRRGIKIEESDGNTISNNDVSNVIAADGCGIYLLSANDNTISNNNASGAGSGIDLKDSNNNFVQDNNDVRNATRHGIGLQGTSAGNVIRDNNASGSGHGIVAYSTGLANQYLHNNVSSTTSVGMIITNDWQFVLSENDFTDSITGLQLENMSALTLDIARLPDDLSTTGLGLYLRNVTNSTVDGLDLSGDGTAPDGTGLNAGLLVRDSSDIIVQGVNIADRAKGIYVNNTHGMVIHDSQIAGNGGDGIVIYGDSSGIRIQGNSIHSNGDLGIDLAEDGVTPNDPGDADTGANNLQNFPVLSQVGGGPTTTVHGSLNSTPDTEFTLDFYANSEADPSGYGEGERWLGAITVTTDANGNVGFDAELPQASAGGEFISATATGPDGTSEFSAVLEIPNTPPVVDDQSFDVDENQIEVGAVVATDLDLPEDTLSFSISGGVDGGLFTMDSATGALSFLAAPDFELPADFDGDNVYQVEVTVIDGSGASDTANVTVNVLNLASITGTVFVDVNENGLYEANEPGIDGVKIELLDASGNPILDEGTPVTATTSDGGFYLLDDLAPATYRVHEVQPTGVDDGAEILGSLLGTIPANDTMQLSLARVNATDYVFAELGQDVSSGDTATIGFWQNKHGQQLIDQGGTDLPAWLSANFGNVFGNTFTDGVGGDDGSEVAAFFKEQLFRQKSEKSAGPAKVDAQFMAVALAAYFTSSDLAGTVAAGYGFNVTDTGIRTKVVNVGANGAAFSVDDGADMTIMQLLLATNDLTDVPDGISDFAHIYDTNGDGVIDSAEAALRAMANDVYSAINQQGDI